MWSLVELVTKQQDQLIDPTAVESYHGVGKQLGCLPLGMLPDKEWDTQLLQGRERRALPSHKNTIIVTALLD
jgi:hypothetical protein